MYEGAKSSSCRLEWITNLGPCDSENFLVTPNPNQASKSWPNGSHHALRRCPLESGFNSNGPWTRPVPIRFIILYLGSFLSVLSPHLSTLLIPSATSYVSNPGESAHHLVACLELGRLHCLTATHMSPASKLHSMPQSVRSLVPPDRYLVSDVEFVILYSLHIL
jgi:hypothetical protein